MDEKPDPNEWMQNARKDTERRAMQFRKAREVSSGAKEKREPRRYSRAGRDLDKIRTAISRGWVLDEETGEYESQNPPSVTFKPLPPRKTA